MILHVVALALRADHDPDELTAVMLGLGSLDLDGFDGIEHGPNIDAEGKSPGYPYGFVCRFRNRAALDRYASDAGHRALGARLIALCQGGADGIMVYDIEV